MRGRDRPGGGDHLRVEAGTILALLMLAVLAVAVLAVAVLAVAVLHRAVGDPEATLVGTDMHVHVSWESANRLAFDAGQVPFWNPFAWSGYPGMADIQTQVFYPPSLLLRRLPLPAFFTWGLVLHLWVVAVGTFALCRQLGTGRVAAMAAGVGMMMSGAIAPKIYAGHMVVLYRYAWFPLALALAIRSAGRQSLLPHPALVVVLTVHVLAGFLQGTVYVFGCLGCYFAGAALARSGRARWYPVAQIALLAVLVFSLAGFQLLPTARLALESERAAHSPWPWPTRCPSIDCTTRCCRSFGHRPACCSSGPSARRYSADSVWTPGSDARYRARRRSAAGSPGYRSPAPLVSLASGRRGPVPSRRAVFRARRCGSWRCR